MYLAQAEAGLLRPLAGAERRGFPSCCSPGTVLPLSGEPTPKVQVCQAAKCCRPLVAQTVKNLPVTQETQVQSLGWEDPLEKGMATHSSIFALEIPWTEPRVHGMAQSQTLLSL